MKISGLLSGQARSGVLNRGQLWESPTPPPGDTEQHLDISGCHDSGRVLPASSRWRPGKQINIPGHPAQHRECSGPKCLECPGWERVARRSCDQSQDRTKEDGQPSSGCIPSWARPKATSFRLASCSLCLCLGHFS